MRYILLCVFLIGCPYGEDKEFKSYDEALINDMTYYKDKRTGLCFATHNFGFDTGMMANVPCTPEVEKLIR